MERQQADLAVWQAIHTLLTDLIENNIRETGTFDSLREPHDKHLKSTNVHEQLNEEIRCRTRVATSSAKTMIK